MTPAFRVRDERDRAVVTLDCGRTEDPTTRANADLISAAPDLLAVLKRILAEEDIVELGDRGPYGESWHSDERMALWVDAKDAVDKAEGRHG